MERILFVSLICCVPWAFGLEMEGVKLQGDKDHLRLQHKSEVILECNIVLEEGETTKTVTWYHEDHLVLKWNPPQKTQVGESLKEGDVVLTRSDGHLQFAALHMNQAGVYRCEVMTSLGETFKSNDYELMIVDMPEIPDNVEHRIQNCTIHFSWHAPAIKPRPEVVCGVWSPVHGYVLKGVNWMASPFYNGSIAYSLDKEHFLIPNLPLDARIRCEAKIIKIDRSEIQLINRTYNFDEVSERGCPPLEIGDGVDITYDNEKLTCRAEVTSKDKSAPVIAHVKCKEGFEAKYRDFVTTIDMMCKGTKWDVGGDLTWNHFDNLICQEKPKLPPQSSAAPLREASVDSTSNGISNSPLTLVAVVLALGITLGAVWSLKQSKRKELRYMA